jgi:predicted NUDIX family NTP pyrophosphohydrolase
MPNIQLTSANTARIQNLLQQFQAQYESYRAEGVSAIVLDALRESIRQKEIARIAMERAERDITNAQQALSSRQSAVQSAQSELQAKTAAFNAAKTVADSARAAALSKETTRQGMRADIDSLSTLNTQLDTLTQAQEAAQTAKVAAEATLVTANSELAVASATLLAAQQLNKTLNEDYISFQAITTTLQEKQDLLAETGINRTGAISQADIARKDKFAADAVLKIANAKRTDFNTEKDRYTGILKTLKELTQARDTKVEQYNTKMAELQQAQAEKSAATAAATAAAALQTSLEADEKL